MDMGTNDIFLGGSYDLINFNNAEKYPTVDFGIANSSVIQFLNS